MWSQMIVTQQFLLKITSAVFTLILSHCCATLESNNGSWTIQTGGRTQGLFA
jgi:hypothetical protein